jgi:dCTP diphosphatase
MKDPQILVDELKKFRDERDWKQFHNHKDLAVSMVLEAAEVLEHFQWKSSEEGEKHAEDNKGKIAEELADVLKYLLQLADNIGVEDIIDVALQKLEKDGKKYPVEKAKGKHTKYTEL